jgi:hypothetical protein
VAEALERVDPIHFDKAPPREESNEPTLCITDNQVADLVGLMKEAGVPERAHSRQLLALAKSEGYQNVESINSEDFDKIKAKLEAGLAKWKEAQGNDTET